MEIKYGLQNNNIDVTNICHNRLKKQNIINIPSGDLIRPNYLGDPLCGVLKSIFIKNVQNNEIVEYDHTKNIYIDTNTNQVYTENIPEYMILIFPDIIGKLREIQSHLKIDFGSFNEEFQEQMMAVSYLNGNEKILEIGGNIGRNSLIIAYILSQKNNTQFVSLECDPNIAKKLEHNKNLNNLNFMIENSALSKRKLIQKGWETIESDILLDGYTSVQTITLDELNQKYNIPFDTLIFDCEGAFYYILMDMPEILNNINLIIMENDYHNIDHKNYIDTILKQNNFYVDYSEPGGWGCCYNNFFEVWKRG